MNHQRLPFIIGSCATIYWLIAFSVALVNALFPIETDNSWWNITMFRVPGYWLGLVIFEAFEGIEGVTYGMIIDNGLAWYLSALVIAAIAIGMLLGFVVRLMLPTRVDN